MKQENIYATKIMAKLQQLFDENDEDYIDMDELMDGDNATHFIHAMVNIAPNIVYQNITGDKQDLLGFSYVANRLACQYSNFSKE